MTAENIIWAAVLDQRGLSRSLISYLFRVGENQMRGLIKQVRPHLEDFGDHSEPIPARLIDPSDLANYVMHATAADRERETPHSHSSTAPHQQLGGPIVLVWDNLNVHRAARLREFAARGTG